MQNLGELTNYEIISFAVLGQFTPKLAIVPIIFAITDNDLGTVSLQITPMISNMILGTSKSTQEVKKMAIG